MKKKNIGFAVLALAATATLSQAAVIFQTTKVATQNGFDIYDINVTGLTGADAAIGPNGVGVSSISGTFTAASTLLTPGKTSTVATNTTNGGGDPSSAAGGSVAGDDFYTGASYVNMDALAGFSRTGQASTTTINHALTSTSFTGTYGITASSYVGPSTFIGGPGAAKGPDVPLLAEIIVPAGSNATFNGTVTTAGGNVGSYSIPLVTPPTGASISLTAGAPGTSLGTVALTRLGAGLYLPGGATDGTDSTSGDYTVTGLADAGTVPTVLAFAGGSNLALDAADIGGKVESNLAALLLDAPWVAALQTPFHVGDSFILVNLANTGASPADLKFAGFRNAIDEVAAVPEPTTISLAGIGAVLAMGRRRRQA